MKNRLELFLAKSTTTTTTVKCDLRESIICILEDKIDYFKGLKLNPEAYAREVEFTEKVLEEFKQWGEDGKS
jgi:hypothetical protein